MEGFSDFFHNGCLWAALIAWFVAQGLKVPRGGKFDWKKFFSAGGMPSSHSAGVVALTVCIGVKYGFGSPYFAICFVFAAVVMYDAAGVRRETGRQGKAINDIVQAVLVEGQPITDDIMKEIVGHKPVEVAMGGLLGLLIAVVLLLLGI